MGGAVCGGPGGRQEFAEFARTCCRQALDEILEIGLRIDAMIPGADEQGIHHGETLASFGAADEQPVLYSNGTGPNVVFGIVVVDLDPTVDRLRGTSDRKHRVGGRMKLRCRRGVQTLGGCGPSLYQCGVCVTCRDAGGARSTTEVFQTADARGLTRNPWVGVVYSRGALRGEPHLQRWERATERHGRDGSRRAQAARDLFAASYRRFGQAGWTPSAEVSMRHSSVRVSLREPVSLECQQLCLWRALGSTALGKA